MASKGTKVGATEEKKIIAFYFKDENSLAVTAKKFDRSKATISKIINKAKGSTFVNEIEQIKKGQEKEILDLFKKEDGRISNIVDKMLSIVDDEKILKQLLTDKGLQQFTAFIGMTADKTLRIKQLDSEDGVNKIMIQDDGFKKALKDSLNNSDPMDLIEKDSI